MSNITREDANPPIVPKLELDATLFKPTDVELQFLRKRISGDDETLRNKVLAIQQEAYSVFPYPCIRSFHFVSLMMLLNPIYRTVVEDSKNSKTILLDLGCCMGSDLRKINEDGYPADRLIGCDLRREYFEIGHKLYNDAAICSIPFFADDIFNVPIEDDGTSSPNVGLKSISSLWQLKGQVNHIYTGAFFHLFNEDTQYAIALRLALIVKKETGSIIFGRHQALSEAGVIDDHMGRTRYGHSPESWTTLWKDVFTQVAGSEFANTRIVVYATLAQAWITEAGSQKRYGMMWNVKIL